jgi:hypothetical protein
MKEGRVWVYLFFLALVNFFAFALVALYLGGDAVNGKIADGHYYLGSHGHYTEVSAGVFTYSRLHTYSVFVTHSLAFLGAFVLSLRGKGTPR